jgi:AcrR family transcriptional regulator
VASPADRPALQRRAIIDAAREMIVAGGLEALSLRRLARQLGVTAPALYGYVHSKQDLLSAIAEAEVERLAERFTDVDDADPIDRIRAHSRAYITYARENPELFQVMLLAPPALPDSGLPAESAAPSTTMAFSTASGAIEDAIASGIIETDDPQMVALMLWSGAHGVATVLQLGLDLPTEFEDAMINEMTDRLLAGYGYRG